MAGVVNAKYRARMAAGLCSHCSRPAADGLTSCRKCVKIINAAFRSRYAERRAAGECVRGCGLPAVAGRSRCEGHLREAREDTARRADLAAASRLGRRAAALAGAIATAATARALGAGRR